MRRSSLEGFCKSCILYFGRRDDYIYLLEIKFNSIFLGIN